ARTGWTRGLYRREFFRLSSPKNRQKNSRAIGPVALRLRQRDLQTRPAFGPIACRNRAAMLRDDPGRDRQSQSRPARVEPRRHERIENVGQDVCGNSTAVILDTDHYPRPPAAILTPR